MPANLTPQYLAAEQKYKQARTPEDKIAALKEMYAYLPKHKGTEKLQGEIKRRLARLRQEQQKGRSRKGHSFYIDREGAGQVLLVGPPNSGKSALLNALTKATTEVADYPFTTHKPHPGMMPYKDIQIQLIDLPPVSARHLDFWVPELIKHGDLVLLVVDLGQAEVLDELEETLNLLRQHKIHVFWRTPEESDPGDFTQVHLQALVVGNKLDLPGAAGNAEVLPELYGPDFPLIPVSAVTGTGLEALRQRIFEALDIVRVYSKRPGKPADLERPFTLERGSTLLDFARAVHKDFAEHLRYARVWGREKFDGQRVNKDYVVEDGDIIELHA